MSTFSHRSAVLFMAFIAILAWMALGMQLNLMISNLKDAELTNLQLTARFFSYFTILTNLLAAINLTFLLAFPVSGVARFFARPSMQTAIAVYLVVVCVGYNLLLRDLWHPTGLQFWIDELLHDVIPLLFLVYWLFFVLKGKLNTMHPISWLLFPVLYLLFILMRGSVDGFYPYPFMHVEEIGYRAVLQNSGWLLLAFVITSYFFVAIDKLLYRRKQRTVIT